MLKVLLKHCIYEICVDVLFTQLYNNFVMPKIIERYGLTDLEDDLRNVKYGMLIELKKKGGTRRFKNVKELMEYLDV